VTAGEIIPNPMPSYLDAIAAEQKYFESTRYEKDKEYWGSLFAEKPQPCRINDKRKTQDTTTNRHICALDDSVCEKINLYCESEGISPAVLFEAIMIAYLHRINDYATPVTINIPVINRSNATEKKTIGMFISTTLLSVPVDENISMTELCLSIKQKHMETFRHQKYPISHILKNLRSKDSDTSGLRDVSISYQNARIDGHGMEISTDFYSNGHSEVPLCLHIEDMGNSGGYKLHFEYQIAILSNIDASVICDRFLHMLNQTLDNRAVKVKDIQIVSPDEYQKVIHDFNDTAIDYPKDKCIHQLFEEQVALDPEKTAVVACDKNLAYRELNEQANKIAHYLIDMGVKSEDIIALMLPRKSYLLSAIIGVLKCGAAYLPIDINYPKERIEYILEDSKANICITEDNIVEIFSVKDSSNVSIEVASDSVCFCIYTSGSTGKPKGTLLHHKGLINLVFWEKYTSNMILPERVALSTTITFDVFTQEVMTALLLGKTAYLASDFEKMNIHEFINFIDSNKVELLFSTPSFFNLITADKKNAECILGTVKEIALAGEAFYLNSFIVDLTAKYKTIFHNQYGPAETHVISIATLINKYKTDITIGKPIANTQIFILDKNLNPLPIGVAGELCISGDGVGHGYLNRPELTAEKFVSNPFIEGKRMYKTGDLARWREDGQLEYIGRMDNQIKLRGIRIELGEIETEIARFEGVKQIAVVDKKDETGRQYICAYYISDETVDENSLRTELAKTLPRYMIPHFFTQVETFPTTASGKTDRKALPPPDFKQSQSGTEYVAPVTEQEKLLVQILESVLEISPIGMNDDFFDIGGDSLKAIEFISKAQYEGIKIDVQNVFEYTTPAKLLKHLSTEDKQSVKYQMDDFNAIHSLLRQNRASAGVPATKQSLGNTLITGATGWLGIHVLDEFLSSESGTVYCLVRGNDISYSQERLNSTLEHYFGDKYKNSGRIITVCGDISNPIELDDKIDTIIHCAANVKHYGAYSSFHTVNVTGTENIIKLAKEKDAVLLHISTAAVSGNSFDHDQSFPHSLFDETKLYIGQPLNNVYVRSKFEAETAVLEARSDGLDAVIIRVGNLVNRRSDLRFQKNHMENATLTRLKAFADLGMYPRRLNMLPIEMSPVDETAKAIIKLAQHYDRVRPVFHIYNDKPTMFKDIAKMLKTTGIKIKAVPMKRFAKKLSGTANDPDKAHIFEAFINDIGEDGNLNIHSNIRLCNRFTTKHLNEIGFNWKKIDNAYLRKYVKHFSHIGYFKVLNMVEI